MNYQKNIKYKIKYSEFILQGGANLKIWSDEEEEEARAREIQEMLNKPLGEPFIHPIFPLNYNMSPQDMVRRMKEYISNLNQKGQVLSLEEYTQGNYFEYSTNTMFERLLGSEFINSKNNPKYKAPKYYLVIKDFDRPIKFEIRNDAYSENNPGFLTSSEDQNWFIVCDIIAEEYVYIEWKEVKDEVSKIFGYEDYGSSGSLNRNIRVENGIYYIVDTEIKSFKRIRAPEHKYIQHKNNFVTFYNERGFLPIEVDVRDLAKL